MPFPSRHLIRFCLSLIVAAVGALRAESEPVRIARDVRFLDEDRAERLDVYFPGVSTAKQGFPAFVWIHGGGFVEGSKGEARAQQICSALARHGYVAASVDYRLGEGAWPQALLDCKNAVRYLRAHSREYNIDGDRIGVGGGSAGGFLALMVASTAGDQTLTPSTPYPDQSDSVTAIVDMYGPIVIGVKNPATGLGAGPVIPVSVIERLHAGFPPTLIIHGRVDPVANYASSEKLAEAMRVKSICHRFILLDGVGHSFDWESYQGRPLPIDLQSEVLSFLAQHMSASPAAGDARPRPNRRPSTTRAAVRLRTPHPQLHPRWACVADLGPLGRQR